MQPLKDRMLDVVKVLETLIEHLIEMEKELTNETRDDITCLDCFNWNHDLNKCNTFNQVPPPYVIAKPKGKCLNLDYVPF